MIARDLLQEAVDELYGGDPADFLPRRKELAAAARAAKDRDAAKAITALRKPTRSAHLLNQLARREPERIDDLLRLADDATAGTGTSHRDALRAMRELTARRRQLIDDLADRAFAGAGDDSPTPVIRDEVVATLNAAVGDPDVGAELAEGRLVRSHEWSGFGFSAADLALVPADEPDEDEQAAEEVDDTADPGVDLVDHEDDGGDGDGDEHDEDSAETAEPDETEKDAAGSDLDHDEAEHNKAEDDDDEAAGDASDEADDASDEEADDDDPAADARAALREADRDLQAQQRAERDQQDRIADLEDELAEAQIRLEEIRLAIRRAEMARRRAMAAADRCRGPSSRA